MPDEKENTVEIEEITQPEPTAFATDGLLPQEVEMAEKHGLIKEEKVDESSKDLRTKDDGSEKETDEHEEQPKPETEDSKGEEEKQEEEVKPTFEDVEKNEDKLKKYNPNEQALYWKYKADKKKRQKAQKEAEEWRAKYELDQVKGLSYSQKLQKISEALKSDNLTVEQIQSIIGETPEEDNTPITKAELKRIESEKEAKEEEAKRASQQNAERLQTAEEIGKTKYDNFEELTKLAQEVVDSDKTDTYKSVLNAAFSDTDIDEEQLVERVVTIARLNPNYGKKKSGGTETIQNVDRAITNSKKKISSATVGSGSPKRAISEDDLTVEDGARLTQSQWMKLKPETKKRLLMK